MSAQTSIDPAVVTADQFLQLLKKRNILWKLQLGTSLNLSLTSGSDIRVQLDGDSDPIVARTLIGPILASERVSIVFVPPAGYYIIGTIGGKQRFGLVSRNTAIVDSANFGTGSFTVIATGPPKGGWPAGCAFEVRFAERLQAVTGTPRISTWISGGAVSTTTLYNGGFTLPIPDTTTLYEHSGILRFTVNTPGVTSFVFLRHLTDAGTAKSVLLNTPAIRWLEVWNIGSSADYPDLEEMV